MIQVLPLIICSACTSPTMQKAEAINAFVNNQLHYEAVNRDPKPLSEIISTTRGNCADYALYKQHLLKQQGITSYVVKGMTTDNLPHAVTMFYDNGERWFLDNRSPYPTQVVFNRAFYNMDTKEGMIQ